MEKELQDDIELVAEYDDAVFDPFLPVVSYPIAHRLWVEIPYRDKASLNYHTSWKWQIPVWAKLWREHKKNDEFDLISTFEYMEYMDTINEDNPRAGFDLLASIIKRIKQ